MDMTSGQIGAAMDFQTDGVLAIHIHPMIRVNIIPKITNMYILIQN